MKFKNKQKQVYNNPNLRWMILMSALTALVILVCYLFNFLKVFNGYSVEVYLVFYIFGLMLLKDKKYAWTFLILLPWIKSFLTGDSVAFFEDFLVEYIAAMYVFFPFIYFYDLTVLINKRWSGKMAKVLIYVAFLILSFVCYTLKLTLHIIAGAIWWTPGQWLGSFIFNVPIIWGSYAISIPVMLILLIPFVNFCRDVKW